MLWLATYHAMLFPTKICSGWPLFARCCSKRCTTRKGAGGMYALPSESRQAPRSNVVDYVFIERRRLDVDWGILWFLRFLAAGYWDVRIHVR